MPPNKTQNLGVKTPEQFQQMAGGQNSSFQNVGKMDLSQFKKLGSITGMPAIERLETAQTTPRTTGETFVEKQFRLNQEAQREFEKKALAKGMDPRIIGLAMGATNPIRNVGNIVTKGSTLTTKLLQKLTGRTSTSKQFIEDLTNSPDLRQPERELFRSLLKGESGTVDVKKFGEKVQAELLPLQRATLNQARTRFENISLSDDLRGPIANYREHIYRSPISTSAGNVHFDDVPNYFAHTRVEDVGDLPKGLTSMEGYYPGGTRRVIEIQSDLFQKGRLEGEFKPGLPDDYDKMSPEDYKLLLDKGEDALLAKNPDYQKLAPYHNTWHERVIREEVKKAAQDGKTKLQFPTGETAMKIEGLGDIDRRLWKIPSETGKDSFAQMKSVTPDMMKVGLEVQQGAGPQNRWVVTDVLGDGKFKAVPKATFEHEFRAQKNVIENAKKIRPDLVEKYGDQIRSREEFAKAISHLSSSESFDISGKIDTNNPIYKFYEKEVGRFLNNQFSAKQVTDPQGVKWWEVDVDKALKDESILAFGKTTLETLLAGAGVTGLAAGAVKADEKLSEAGAVEFEATQNKPQSLVADSSSEDNKGFTERIVGVENEALATSSPKRLYASVGVSGDLGKYQASPQTLKEWSEPWLGKTLTPEEFLKDPEAQEEFWSQFLAVKERYNLSDDEGAIAWHMGWGELGTGDKETREERFREKLEKNMSSLIGRRYLEKFNR